jgi:AAA+ ATPase superfamily predicted ATPase
MKFVIGNPAEGDNFYGREEEQSMLWKKLDSEHILMLAPRRVGKTSLLKKLIDTAEQHSSTVLYCSFAKCIDEMGCINELLKAVSQSKTFGRSVFEGVVSNLKKVKGVSFAGAKVELDTAQQSNWIDVGEILTSTLSELKNSTDNNSTNLIICVDELPIFILKLLEQEGGKNNVRYFLNWFRDLRQSHHNDIKWILAGSVGLDSVTARLNIGDTINDLAPFHLGEFDSGTAKNFILELSKQYEMKISNETCNSLITQIGWLAPYYLQILTNTIYTNKTCLIDEVTEKDIKDAFEELLKPTNKSYFDYWRQRLTEELGKPNDTYAIAILSNICHSTTGVSVSTLKQVLASKTGEIGDVDDLLFYLLDILENDGYLICNKNDCYQFRFTLLALYWKKRVAR